MNGQKALSLVLLGGALGVSVIMTAIASHLVINIVFGILTIISLLSFIAVARRPEHEYTY